MVLQILPGYLGKRECFLKYGHFFGRYIEDVQSRLLVRGMQGPTGLLAATHEATCVAHRSITNSGAGGQARVRQG